MDYYDPTLPGTEMLKRNIEEQVDWLLGKNSGDGPVLNDGTVRVDIKFVTSVSSSAPLIRKDTDES